MEKTHAVVLMPEYLELIDFKKSVLANKIPWSRSSDYERYRSYFYSTDEALQELADENGQLVEKLNEASATNEDLQRENDHLKKRLPKPPEPAKEITLEDLKKMSYWEFRKWRRS